MDDSGSYTRRSSTTSDGFPGSPLGYLSDRQSYSPASMLLSRENLRLQELEAENAALANKNHALAIQAETWRYNHIFTSFTYTTDIYIDRLAHDRLVEQIPALMEPSGNAIFAREVLPVTLDPNDYTEVTYWTKELWDAVRNAESGVSNKVLGAGRGRGRAADGINVALLYVQQSDGTVIDGHRVKAIKGHAYSIWHQYRSKNVHPKSWGVCGLELKRQFNTEMLREYPELGLCANQWKLHEFATQLYPTWYGSYGNPLPEFAIKAEDKDLENLTEHKGTNNLQKRRAASDEARVLSKKQKVSRPLSQRKKYESENGAEQTSAVHMYVHLSTIHSFANK